MSSWENLRSRDVQIGTATPSNLGEAFRKFLSSLELSDPHSVLVADRHNALRDRIREKAGFKIEKTVLYGSYDRSTQIRPRSTDEWSLDVDVLIILANTQADIDKYFNNDDGGYALLEALRKAVHGFQGLEIEKDEPAVSAKWRTLKMKVEVTPAFRKLGGGFLIPSSSWFSSAWAETNPVGDGEMLSRANKDSKGLLIPLIKALKCWNRKEGKPLSSFAIEAAAYHSAGLSFQSFEFELEYFFKKLLEWDGKFIEPPSGIGGKVKIDLTWSRDRVRRALKKIENAKALDIWGRNREAILEMARVFGAPFPLANTLGPFDGIWN